MKSGTDIEKIGGWQREWGDSFRRLGPLLDYLGLDMRDAPATAAEHPDFPLLVPKNFARRMRRGDWNDPLLRQVLPLALETEDHPGFSADPVGDGAAEEIPGLLRKYRGRALLLLTGACAVHCRYCFRREFPYGEGPATREQWTAVYSRIAQDPGVGEIIFSGGDPLSLSDAKLDWHVDQALNLPGIRRLRFHTRLPVVMPARVDGGFLHSLVGWTERKPVILVLHANHARELDAEVEAAAHALRASGAMLLNQAVLMRGVNDTPDALSDLSERLLDCGVLPYYLHQLDRVRGAQHFEVPEEKGLALLEELKARLPGYALPRYVREIPGRESKTGIPCPAPEAGAFSW